MTTLLEATAAGLRASADVHDAERIPHLSEALRALADALDTYQPVEPGPCPGRLELQTVESDGAGGIVSGVHVLTCRFRATHAGLHEEAPYLDGRPPARWSDPDPNEAYWNARAENDRRKLAAVHQVVAEMKNGENDAVAVAGHRLDAILRRTS